MSHKDQQLSARINRTESVCVHMFHFRQRRMDSQLMNIQRAVFCSLRCSPPTCLVLQSKQHQITSFDLKIRTIESLTLVSRAYCCARWRFQHLY